MQQGSALICYKMPEFYNVILSWKLWGINICIIDLLSVFIAVVGSSRSTKKCLLHFPDFGGVPVCGPYRLRSWDWAVRYSKHRLKHETVDIILHYTVCEQQFSFNACPPLYTVTHSYSCVAALLQFMLFKLFLWV